MDRRTVLISLAGIGAMGAMPAFAGGHGNLGTFVGKKGYNTKGTAELVKEGGAWKVNLLDDFSFPGAPDPKVALGKDGYDKSTLMGLLKNNKGASSYTVPSGIDGSKYNEVWIWCEKFNVPLGVAKLN